MLVFDWIIGKVFQLLQPSLADEYLSGIFRPWSDPRMMLYFLYPFIVGIIMAFIWDKTKGLFTGETTMKNGINFGLIAFVVFVLPGMFVTYTSFTVSLALVLTWAVSGFVGLVLAGIVLAKVSE